MFNKCPYIYYNPEAATQGNVAMLMLLMHYEMLLVNDNTVLWNHTGEISTLPWESTEHINDVTYKENMMLNIQMPFNI